LKMNAFGQGALAFFLLISSLGAAPRNAWVATWAASPEPVDVSPDEPLLNIEDQTVRDASASPSGEWRCAFASPTSTAPRRCSWAR